MRTSSELLLFYLTCGEGRGGTGGDGRGGDGRGGDGRGGDGRGGEGCDGGVHSTLSAALSIAVYSHFTVWSPDRTLHTAIIVTKVLEQWSFT